MKAEDIETIAESLAEAGYGGLFLYGSRSLSDSIWQNGANRGYLEEIVRSDKFPAPTRFLASEILFEKLEDYPPAEWQDALAPIYAQALAESGEGGSFHLSGNLWGFMYYLDEMGMDGAGTLGKHLMTIGGKVIPHLIGVLDNSRFLYYEGSREATLGNSLGYRIKDAAAYYIGRITGIPVKFYKEIADRDAEIERLKVALKSR